MKLYYLGSSGLNEIVTVSYKLEILIRIIQGSIIIFDNSDTGCQVYMFQVFDEIWISFRLAGQLTLTLSLTQSLRNPDP